MLEAERRAKVERVVEPERATLENGLHRFAQFSTSVARIQSGRKGFHFAGGDFPTGAGFAYGIGFTDLAVGSIYADPDRSNRVDVNAVAAYSTSEYVQLSGDLALRNLGGSPITLDVRGKFFEHPKEDFYGLGSGSDEINRTSYLLRSTDVGADLTWHPAGGLRVGAGVAYLMPSIGSGRDSRFPSTDELFDPSALSGFEDQPDFLRLSARVAYDGRDNARLPRVGGYYGVHFTDFRDQDLETFDFRRIDVDLQQYLPWFQGYRVLALRAAATMTEADTGHDVPFYYMPNLGGGERLRGFREFRFRDRNSLLFTAEYRWEAWWALDMALFAEAGKVTFDRRDLDLTGLGSRIRYGLSLSQ